MARIKEYPSITSFDGTNDALAIEQTDGANNRTRKVTPAQLKQYMEAGDFEATGELEDGHGNVLKNVAGQVATKVEGLVYSRTDNTSLTARMDSLKAQGKNGAYIMYCSSANPDFSTIGYCEAIGLIVNGAVSVIAAVNSQTGDVWTNGNTSQDAGAWRGWKKVSSDKRSISASPAVIGSRVDLSGYTDVNNPYITPHEGFVRFAGTNIDLRLYATDAMRSSSATDVRAMWLPKGAKISFSNTPNYAHWYNCLDE